ncbi:MAG: hypothetical protein ACRYGP_13155 [Janthinobacterium lividum]
MMTTRRAALATLILGFSCAPALAATCNLTIKGALVIDDATCTVSVGRGLTTAEIEGGSTVTIRRMMMSASPAADPALSGRRRKATSFGMVVRSDRTDDKVCYFNQKAVFCVEP